MGSRLEQKSNLVRKRIEQHTFDNEQGEEYEGSKFGGFPEYFRRKKIKLQNLDAEIRAHSDKPVIFKGIVCHVNGYTQPSLKDLHTMIVEYGGGFIQYLDGKTMVTHIIASTLTPKKKEEFKRYRVVKPAWIVDSIAAGKLLPWDAYRVIDEGAAQKILGFDKGKVVSQVNRKTNSYREQTDRSWYNQQLASSSRSQLIDAKTPTHPIFDHADVEFTSSVEKALLESFHEDEDEDEHAQSDDLTLAHTSDDELGERGQEEAYTDMQQEQEILEAQQALVEDKVQQTTLDQPVPQASPEIDAPQISSDEAVQLRPREGSQEPDYTMAVIANSDVMKSVPPERLAQMTAEEHNALLLSDPKIRKSTVVHPDFLEQYYRESRLHHLSTWKADLKAQLQALANAKSSQQPKLKKLPGQRRYIMHVDFDCFFVAVSLKRCPELSDKPCVVAHGGGSGSEIASCNYLAREFGVKNGMWMRRAQELCSTLKILPYDYPAYEDASRKFYDAIIGTGGVVQSVSVDEALVDISALCFSESGTEGIKRHEGAVYREQQKADDVAKQIRDQVFKETNCAVSVGIGANILQAKVALRHAKPAGQYQLKPEDVLDFLGKLEVQALPGIAYSIGNKLEGIGVKLVKDIRECTRERLMSTLGPKTGEKLWEYARGIDKAEVGDQVVRKSISAEVNWGVRFENQEQVDEFMAGLAGELHRRLLKENVKGKHLTLKVMRRATDAPLDPPKHLGHGKCDTFNKSLQLGVATNDLAILIRETTALMRSFGISPGELRGIGLHMQKLEAIKISDVGQTLGSQKRLQFKTGSHERHKTGESDNPAATIPKPGPSTSPKNKSSIFAVTKDGIDSKLLNTMGTQFVLPTQVDLEVLAELPEDVRSRLARRMQDEPINHAAAAARDFTSPPLSPTGSHIDPETLNALPEDLRREVLGASSPRKARQTVLPQSPRKARALPLTKQSGKRSKVGSLRFTRSRPNDTSTLTQSNFVTKPLVVSDHDSARDSPAPEDEVLDEAFLAALPEELRKEVIAQQRQQRLQKTGGIDTSLHQRPRALQKKTTPAPLRVFELPPPPPVATFTSERLSSLPDLRIALESWITAFVETGPVEDDLDAFIVYIREVISEEKNTEKAVALWKWILHILDGRLNQQWREALNLVKRSMQEAMSQRGIRGKLKFV